MATRISGRSLTGDASAINGSIPGDLDGLHLPTGRVSLEAVIRMLITEFAIAPRRADWRRTLDRTEAAFREEVTQRP